MITSLFTADYPSMIELWDRSVRASHSFLSESDLQEIRANLPSYFNAVELRGWRDQSGQLLGFIGIANQYIEMLFIDAEVRGQGFGKVLLEWARCNGAVKVDVNEQNPQALSFYRHLGFDQISRSETDGQGRPFPIIHLEFNNH